MKASWAISPASASIRLNSSKQAQPPSQGTTRSTSWQMQEHKETKQNAKPEDARPLKNFAWQTFGSLQSRRVDYTCFFSFFKQSLFCFIVFFWRVLRRVHRVMALELVYGGFTVFFSSLQNHLVLALCFYSL